MNFARTLFSEICLEKWFNKDTSTTSLHRELSCFSNMVCLWCTKGRYIFNGEIFIIHDFE